MEGNGEPGQENAFKSCDGWEYETEFIVENNELEIIVTNLDNFNEEFVFSNKFKPDDLRKMGLNCRSCVSKIERLLTQANSGDSEEAHLYYLLRGPKPDNDLAEGPIVNTLGDFVKTLVLRLEWNSLIGDLNFQFPLQRILPNSEHYWARERQQMKDRVQHLEYEVKFMKNELERTRNELSRLTRIVENIQHPIGLDDNDSIVFNGHEEDRFLRVERKRRNKKHRHGRRGAVQLDRAPSQDFDGSEFSFSQFSDYDSYRRLDNQSRRVKNHSCHSLPPSFCNSYI